MKIDRITAINTLLIWDEQEGILDHVTLDSMTNEELEVELKARQTIAMNESYEVVDQVTHKDSIRSRIDDYFSTVARRLSLENGDITPSQEDRLNTAIVEIARVVEEWEKQNK